MTEYFWYVCNVVHTRESYTAKEKPINTLKLTLHSEEFFFFLFLLLSIRSEGSFLKLVGEREKDILKLEI